MNNILILEDDNTLLETLYDELSDLGYHIEIAKHGEKALELCYEKTYDLYIFDINVPYIDGLSLLQELRKSFDTTPTILLTSKKDITDKLKGFESGCDDYITKPFSLQELVYRINTILKRVKKPQVFNDKNFTINFTNKTLIIKDKKIEVDKRLFEILCLFVMNPNEIISYDYIIEKIYREKTPTTTVIRVHISKINALFDEKIIKNIRGSGYIYDKV